MNIFKNEKNLDFPYDSCIDLSGSDTTDTSTSIFGSSQTIKTFRRRSMGPADLEKINFSQKPRRQRSISLPFPQKAKILKILSFEGRSLKLDLNCIEPLSEEKKSYYNLMLKQFEKKQPFTVCVVQEKKEAYIFDASKIKWTSDETNLNPATGNKIKKMWWLHITGINEEFCYIGNSQTSCQEFISGNHSKQKIPLFKRLNRIGSRISNISPRSANKT